MRTGSWSHSEIHWVASQQSGLRGEYQHTREQFTLIGGVDADRIVVTSHRIPALLKWTHESSVHVGADCTLKLFKQWFHSTWSNNPLRKIPQPIVDKCPCRSCKPGDIRDRGLYSILPIPHCANSVLYVDYTEMPKLGGYYFALVVTCGLTRFTRVFPCTKYTTGEQTFKILLE